MKRILVTEQISNRYPRSDRPKTERGRGRREYIHRMSTLFCLRWRQLCFCGCCFLFSDTPLLLKQVSTFVIPFAEVDIFSSAPATYLLYFTIIISKRPVLFILYLNYCSAVSLVFPPSYQIPHPRSMLSSRLLKSSETDFFCFYFLIVCPNHLPTRHLITHLVNSAVKFY